MSRGRRQRRGNLTRAELLREQMRNRQNYAWRHMTPAQRQALAMEVAAKLAAHRGTILARHPKPMDMEEVFRQRDELAAKYGEDHAWDIIAMARGHLER